MNLARFRFTLLLACVSALLAGAQACIIGPKQDDPANNEKVGGGVDTGVATEMDAGSPGPSGEGGTADETGGDDTTATPSVDAAGDAHDATGDARDGDAHDGDARDGGDADACEDDAGGDAKCTTPDALGGG